MKYIVYQTINKENGKLYIGVHKTKNPDVFDGYIGNGIEVGWSLENPKTPFQHALKKYGYKAFIRTTLFVFDTEEEAYQKEADIVTLSFIKQSTNYNIKTGGVHGSWNFKTIYQFDLNGNFKREWDSVQKAIEYYGCNLSRLKMAVYEKYSAFESYWNYSDTIDVTQYRRSKHSELYQFDLEGRELQVYHNTIAASKILNYSINSLNEAVSKKRKYKDCYWTKDPDSIFSIIKMNQLYDTKNTAVIQYDKDKQVLQEYIDVSLASKELNIKYADIVDSIKNKSLYNDEYYFEYASVTRQGDKRVAQYDKETNQLIKVWDTMSECAKIHPKARDVIRGGRTHTHGYTFKYID